MAKFKVGNLVTMKGWEGRVFTIREITPPRYVDHSGLNLPLLYTLDNGINVEEKYLKFSSAAAAAAGGRHHTKKSKSRSRKTRRARK
jgi:hypothetical protein